MRRWAALLVGVLLAPILILTLGWSPPRPDPCGGASVTTALGGDAGGWVVPVRSSGARLSVRVASWNTLAANSTARVVAGVRDLTRVADVIGVQELAPESRRRAVDRSLPKGWAASTGNNAVRIYYRSARFALVAEGSDQVFGPTPVEAGVAGTSLGPKSIQGMQLRDKTTGAVFGVLNHHLVPSIDRGGRPDPSVPRRLDLADQQLDVAFGLAGRLRAYGPVAITADWNIDADGDAKHRDPAFVVARAAAAGMATDQSALGRTDRPTHGDRRIDYVAATTSFAFRGHRVLGKSGSDHAPVVVDLTGTAAAPAAVAAKAPAVPAPAVAAAALPPSVNAAGIQLGADQIRTAAAGIAAGKALGVPPAGWVVITTAGLQESELDATLTEGQSDRDSAGWLQQRRAWGPLPDRLDPYKAAVMFYRGGQGGQRGLLQVPSWQTRDVAEVVQAVQVSAYPDAYRDDVPVARALVRQMAGSVAAGAAIDPLADPAAACGADVLATELGSCPATGLAAEVGLTADALRVLRCGEERFPKISTYYGVGQRPGNPTSDHPSGNGVDFMVSDLPDYRSGVGSAYGWQVARWLQANASALGVKYLVYAAKIWSVERADEGWRPYTRGTGDTALHYDHVHVSTYGTRGTGLTGDATGGGSGWRMPLATGTYTVGTRFGVPGPMWQSGRHTGQDFRAATGTPVVSATPGRVIQAEHSGPFGNHVVVQVDARTRVYYAHLIRRDLEVGGAVEPGTPVGLVGRTGNTTGPHLHLEVRAGGAPVDPLPLLAAHGARA